MKWLILAVLLAGCTAVHISGDNNTVTIDDPVTADVSPPDKKKR